MASQTAQMWWHSLQFDVPVGSFHLRLNVAALSDEGGVLRPEARRHAPRALVCELPRRQQLLAEGREVGTRRAKPTFLVFGARRNTTRLTSEHVILPDRLEHEPGSGTRCFQRGFHADSRYRGLAPSPPPRSIPGISEPSSKGSRRASGTRPRHTKPTTFYHSIPPRSATATPISTTYSNSEKEASPIHRQENN